MTAIINASTSSGLITTADTSGVLQFQSNGTAAAGVSSSNFQMNSGYGSVATAYGCRAWVNFNGSGTVAIRASGNVTSITDNGTGLYTINFTTAMPDAYYSFSGMAGDTGASSNVFVAGPYSTPTTTTAQIRVDTHDNINADRAYVYVSFFR
jgi:hypothetical protein